MRRRPFCRVRGVVDADHSSVAGLPRVPPARPPAGIWPRTGRTAGRTTSVCSAWTPCTNCASSSHPTASAPCRTTFSRWRRRFRRAFAALVTRSRCASGAGGFGLRDPRQPGGQAGLEQFAKLPMGDGRVFPEDGQRVVLGERHGRPLHGARSRAVAVPSGGGWRSVAGRGRGGAVRVSAVQSVRPLSMISRVIHVRAVDRQQPWPRVDHVACATRGTRRS